MRTEYLIDTHIVVWLLTGDKKLHTHIREDIEYYQHTYHVSCVSLLEMLQLKQLKKTVLNQSYAEIVEILERLNIIIDDLDFISFLKLEELPYLNILGTTHTDVMDRYLIAHAIAHHYTMVSADLKFPAYREYGLVLVENK